MLSWPPHYPETTVNCQQTRALLGWAPQPTVYPLENPKTRGLTLLARPSFLALGPLRRASANQRHQTCAPRGEQTDPENHRQTDGGVGAHRHQTLGAAAQHRGRARRRQQLRFFSREQRQGSHERRKRQAHAGRRQRGRASAHRTPWRAGGSGQTGARNRPVLQPHGPAFRRPSPPGVLGVRPRRGQRADGRASRALCLRHRPQRARQQLAGLRRRQ